jgi:hypothetical protein
MEEQITINAILSLSGVLDALNRAKADKQSNINFDFFEGQVLDKLLELINKL